MTEDLAVSLDQLRKYCPTIVLLCEGRSGAGFQFFSRKPLLLAPEPLLYQRASSAVAAAEGKKAVTGVCLVPQYLRKPQAQRERERKLR
jgi:uncharacterized membrane protein